MTKIFIFCAIVALLYLCYSVIPTVLIRVSGWGIHKKTKADGIALTFDDGPNAEYTPQLLDLLKKYDVKATFFVVGNHAKKNPDIMKRMAEEGHTIGIHHFDHVSSWTLSPFRLKQQLDMADQAIYEITHEKVHFYRPPWGHFNLFTLLLGKRYHIIMWSNIFGDWKVENAKNILLDQMRIASTEGSIFLLHDDGENPGADKEAPHYMMQNLGIFLEECQQRNVRFITLKELLQKRKL